MIIMVAPRMQRHRHAQYAILRDLTRPFLSVSFLFFFSPSSLYFCLLELSLLRYLTWQPGCRPNRLLRGSVCQIIPPVILQQPAQTNVAAMGKTAQLGGGII